MVFFTAGRDTLRWILPFKPVFPRRPPLGMTIRQILPMASGLICENAAAASSRFGEHVKGAAVRSVSCLPFEQIKGSTRAGVTRSDAKGLWLARVAAGRGEEAFRSRLAKYR